MKAGRGLWWLWRIAQQLATASMNKKCDVKRKKSNLVQIFSVL